MAYGLSFTSSLFESLENRRVVLYRMSAVVKESIELFPAHYNCLNADSVTVKFGETIRSTIWRHQAPLSPVNVSYAHLEHFHCFTSPVLLHVAHNIKIVCCSRQDEHLFSSRLRHLLQRNTVFFNLLQHFSSRRKQILS